jgi:hypothetical protein
MLTAIMESESRFQGNEYHQTSITRHPASGIRHPASGIRHPASGIRHPPCGIRLSHSVMRPRGVQ